MALPYFYQVIAGIFLVIFSWKEMSIIPTIIRRNIINEAKTSIERVGKSALGCDLGWTELFFVLSRVME